MDPAATNYDQKSNDLDNWFPNLEEITPLGAVVQEELLNEPEVTYSASAVREMVNNAVKGVHEEYAGQIATLQAQIEGKDKGKGKMVEPEREPFHTTLPEIHPELATASSQEIVSPISRLEGKIDSLRTEMRGDLTVVMNSLMDMHSQIRTLEINCQTVIDLLKRKRDDRNDPVRRERKNSKKVRLDTSTTTGTSVGAVPTGTYAVASGDVDISSDRDCDADGQKSPKRSEPLSLDDLEKYFEVPLEGAAKALNISSTGLKNRCRELSIGRWPHRKLDSLKSLIENCKGTLSREEMEILEENRRMIEKNPWMELTQEAVKIRLACYRSGYKKGKTPQSQP